MLPFSIRELIRLTAPKLERVYPPNCSYCGFKGSSSKQYEEHEEKCKGSDIRYQKIQVVRL